MLRTRPIQARPLGACRLMILHAAADTQAVAPLLDPLRRCGAALDVRVVDAQQPFAPGWLTPQVQDADRVVLLWSAAAAACPPIDQIDATSGLRYRHRLHLIPLDATPVPERLQRFMLPRLGAALAALGSGKSRLLIERLVHMDRGLAKVQRWSLTAFMLTVALGLGAVLIHGPPLLRFAFIGPGFLTGGTAILLRYWAWINRRYQGQRIALLLADRQLG